MHFIKNIIEEALTLNLPFNYFVRIALLNKFKRFLNKKLLRSASTEIEFCCHHFQQGLESF